MPDLTWLECLQFLQDEGIEAMDWPARSPDLNPIGHIWDIMSRTIHQRHVAPQTVQELVDALVQSTGLLVDVSISDHSIVIKFSDYYEGAAPALIMNHTPRSKLTYSQSGIEEETVLMPGETKLFAWADPTGTKKLIWTYSQNKGELDLLKDESGQFAYNHEIQIHWVSFLDGRQRVLLFTEDVALVTKARQAEEMEQPDQEVNISIHSLGLSLINNETKQEISYIGITSSGVIWELMPKQKWKPFNQKQILQLEQAYEKYLPGEQCRWTKLDGNFEGRQSTPVPQREDKKRTSSYEDERPRTGPRRPSDRSARPWRRCSDTDNDSDRCSVAVWSLESCHTDRSPATNDAGNQGKHRILTYRCLSSSAALCFSALLLYCLGAGKQSGDVTALLSGSQTVQEECRAQRWRTDGCRCIIEYNVNCSFILLTSDNMSTNFQAINFVLCQKRVNIGLLSAALRLVTRCLPWLPVKTSLDRRHTRRTSDVDNQLPGSMFPAVFHPVAPPKSIALDSEPKPFIDVSIITRFNEFSKVMQFKYFMVLIQCMALKIDQGFLAAIMGLFTPSSLPEVEKQRVTTAPAQAYFALLRAEDSTAVRRRRKGQRPGACALQYFVCPQQGRANYACAGAVAEDQKRTYCNEDGRRRSGPETPIRPNQQRDRPWVTGSL
ncbi:unnamed protein product [Ranitomeya imitator]|uniref:Uncharacterized protein n=1 Tax=Ranitomeya imitator TaxID=111125 RepID=A0ABN9L1P3_9NEOB|nr:unnamed protein product [Ranitomeya imitator]